MRIRWLYVLALMVPVCAALAQPAPRSGYEFMEAATQAIQDDDFLNPGFFLVDEGQRLWTTPMGPDGKTCGGCHGSADESMPGVATRYPAYDPDLDRVFNLETRIQFEIAERMNARPIAYDAPELLALTTLVSYQSRGMQIQAPTAPELQPLLQMGRELYEQRRGQLNLSCQQCHVDHAGDRLRGDVISQGHINAFPIYRLLWGEPGLRHRMFEWCMISVRAEPYERGSMEFIALELYLSERGAGLPIEAPGVRR